MTLRKVRLELARCTEFPLGSVGRGYEFIAPLTRDGELDPREWKDARDKCTVRRFWGASPEEKGKLIHRRDAWAFSYVPESEADDEPIFRFDRHLMKPGEYVSITEHDGVQRTFCVMSVE
jgi:hypothetical protein